MPIRMEAAVAELPEIKSEIKAEDFCELHSAQNHQPQQQPTPESQQQQQPPQQQPPPEQQQQQPVVTTTTANNWVGKTISNHGWQSLITLHA